jgi:glyoxylase-like metal-dependent hydrolase (beta-lactamase superfamily II)
MLLSGENHCRFREGGVLVFLLVSFALVVAFVSPARGQAPLVQRGNTLSIADNVYIIPDQRVNLVPNVGIIVGGRGIMVVDTGMGPQNAETVLAEIRKISNKPILYLTITHFHPEHGMGAQAFPPETTVIYPKAQKEELFEKGEAFLKMFSGFNSDIAKLLKGVRIVSPDVTYKHEAEIDLGGMLVRLIHFGAAHTRGDNFVYLPKQKILFAGDIVVNRFFPILPDPDSRGSNWIKILEKLEELAPAKVVPGHGAVSDASLITRMKEYLVDVRDRVAALAKAGRSLEAIEVAVASEIREKYNHWDNPEWIKNTVDNFHRELGKQ